MQISVNLATRPFVELRPLFARLRLAIGLLVLSAVAMAFAVNSLSAKAKRAQAQMDALKGQTNAFVEQRSRNEARMRQPQNQAVLDRSRFLNALFARKSFSWTAVMMDLERMLPQGVQVTSIDPVIAKTGEVSIRLRVVGDRDKTIQLVRNLEHSSRFVRARLSGETAVAADKAKAIGLTTGGAAPGLQTVGDQPTGAVEFEIFSGYNPLPAAVAAEAKEDGKAGKAGKPDPDDDEAAPAPANKPVRQPRRPRAPLAVPVVPVAAGRPAAQGVLQKPAQPAPQGGAR